MTDATGQFLRGSRVLEPITHLVLVTLNNGAQVVRRCALTAAQMSEAESSLMLLKHDGEIRDCLITAAEDVNFAGLMSWLAVLRYRPEQVELLNVSQDTLFPSGGEL